MLANIDHCSIVKIDGWLHEDTECIHIVAEKSTGGELFKIIENVSPCGSMSQFRAAGIINCLFEAVACLCANGVVQRDIKPENIPGRG